MERGIYFDAWFPRQHCYHPSLPARRLRMIEDLKDYRATLLVWSALGGGSISLPFLEQEAYGSIDPRFRFYGFVNDSEFIRECQVNGIKVFGIVFEVQGWEFPVELNEAEDRILAFNELRGTGKQTWMGLREFSQNRFPKLWAPVEKYFPQGLVNSNGEKVNNIIEECCSRDIHGIPCHARWVECPDRDHECYLMDRNNPVWREYLKAIIRIQIDAGVAGIQLDETETPITSFQYGGCFCKDCMRGFRSYLQSLSAEKFSPALAGVDLNQFHYGEWLSAQGYDFKNNREDTPLFWEYLRYQQGAITDYFGELADYAREYASSQGKTILVSGNFFNLFDQYYPLEPKVDLIITEMRNTRYRQPAWYRYVAGFAGRKPVVVVENPYGGVISELVEKLKTGKGYDLFRMSIYEAAALGANMSVPYGSWMGSVIQDSFYAPHELCVEVQAFLADHEGLFSSTTACETAVVYSVESNQQLVARRDLFADNRENLSAGEEPPFWTVCNELTQAAQPYDVLFFPEGQLRPDMLCVDDFRQYRTIILPDCRYFTDHQGKLLLTYLQEGGNIIIMGEAGLNLPVDLRHQILNNPHTVHLTNDCSIIDHFHDSLQVKINRPGCLMPNLAIHLQRVSQGVAVHILRYDYNEREDSVPLMPELDLDLHLAQQYQRVKIFTPVIQPKDGAEPAAPLNVLLESRENIHHLLLSNLPLYSILLLHNDLGD